MRYLRKNTAVTVVVGPLVDWADGKTLLTDNATFDPTKLTCELVKNATSQILTLSKTTGDNIITLTGHGLATLTLSAANTDTEGSLRISITNAVVGGYPTDYILPSHEDYRILYGAITATQTATPALPGVYRRDPDGLASNLKEDTVHFIGGIGTKAGSANSAGGVTLTALAAYPDLATHMDANGGPIQTRVVTPYDHQTGSGKLKLHGSFNSWIAVPGSLIRCIFADTYPSGVYRITERTDSHITLDLDYIAAPAGDSTIYIGGAFPSMAAAVADDSTNELAINATSYQRLMLTDLDRFVSDPLPEGEFVEDPDAPAIVNIENWAVASLAALGVFKTVGVWKHQIAADKGGLEAWDKYAPFAFVGEEPTGPDREGGYDLNRKIRIVILIGQKSHEDGAARVGDDQTVGTIELRDSVIAAIEGSNPGACCDDFYYTGGSEVVDAPRKHGVELSFEAQWIPN
jgi:hypothetical protein